MDLNATIDIIIKDLNEVREIIDDLKKYQGVPALQVELAKLKCKSVAEVIALLKDFHESFSAVKPKEPEKNEPEIAPVKIAEVTHISEITLLSEAVADINKEQKPRKNRGS